MDSPLNRLLGVRQTSSQLYSTLGQSPTCVSHPMDEYCLPVCQFQESSQWSYSIDVCSQQADRFLYPEQTYNLFSFQQKEMHLDTNMPQRRFQYVENSNINFSTQWPYFPNEPPQQINYFSYPALSQESNFFTPKRDESHPLQLSEGNSLSCYDFQPLSFEEERILHASLFPYNRYELFPESEDIFQIAWKSAKSGIDQSSNDRKRLPCFINITDETRVDSPMFSPDGSPEQTDGNVILRKNIDYLIDYVTMVSETGIPVANPEINQANQTCSPEYLSAPSVIESPSTYSLKCISLQDSIMQTF